MDAPNFLWNAGLTVASGLGTIIWAWLVFFVKREIKKMDDLDNRMGACNTMLGVMQLDVAKNYATKAELVSITDRLEKRFDDGVEKLDRKLDTLFHRLDNKADKP